MMTTSLINNKNSKRSHDSIGGAMSASQASSELMSSLSSSLHQMLLLNNNNNNPTTSTTTTQSSSSSSQSQWLDDAMTKVGVSSNVAALKLWSDYGRENDEQFCNVRYLVWVCRHVLLFNGDDASPLPPLLPTSSSLSLSLLDVLRSWQRSMESLIITPINNDDDDDDNNDDSEESEMGVMWQMLLHSTLNNITPTQLSSAYHRHRHRKQPQQQQLEEYNNHLHNVNIRNTNNIDDDISYCFLWPSFFRDLVEDNNNNDYDDEIEAGKKSGSNKRRKTNHHYSDHGNNIFSSLSATQQQQQSNLANTAWWPLFGYTITHALLSSSFSNNNDNNNNQTTTTTIQQKLHQLLHSSIIDSLPSIMGIPCFDHVKKQSLLSGVVACILDVLGKGLVAGSLRLDNEGGSGVGMMIGEGGEEEDGVVHRQDILEVGVDQIVDLLLLCQG